MTTVRVLVGVSVVVAVIVAWFLAVGAGVDGLGLAVGFAGLGHPGYAVWLGWLLVAPVVLLGAAAALRRTPWPWVVAESLHLAALVAAAARVEQKVPTYAWVVLAAVLVLGLGSVVASLQPPGERKK